MTAEQMHTTTLLCSVINALVTLPKKWAEPGPRQNLNFGTGKISSLGRAFSIYYHTDLCKFEGNV